MSSSLIKDFTASTVIGEITKPCVDWKTPNCGGKNINGTMNASLMYKSIKLLNVVVLIQ